MGNPLQAAIDHHQHGRLHDAAQVYQAVLASNPYDTDALHLLGVVDPVPETFLLVTGRLELHGVSDFDAVARRLVARRGGTGGGRGAERARNCVRPLTRRPLAPWY